ncbi:MAG: sigma 54-interacting transcriptional regulator [Planctomycetaceae bacterium]|nr:sigma 54-interacting transcriptional regulator [Planctomycetaceae bacterium]
MHLHEPRLAVLDLRTIPSQQMVRAWATVAAQSEVRFVLVGLPGSSALVPDLSDDVRRRVCILELSAGSPDVQEAAELCRSREAFSQNCLHVETDLDSTTEPPARSVAAQPPSRLPSAEPSLPQSGTTVTPPPAEQGQSLVDRFRTRTPELRQMLKRLEVAARHNVTILLIGETGSGKTHLASQIHQISSRAAEPFVHVACGALPGELIESELFGHVKGAFTSAHADKEGKFVAAGRGSILLDEIDVLTPDQQVKLLRVIEKGEFEPVGSNQTLQVKARLIAASNLQLQPLVESGRFRPDLYYRLNTLAFTIPPLRKRLPDIEPLARYFVHHHARQLGVEVVEIVPEFIECLMNYPWPGNVREMENAIRSAVIYGTNGRMVPDTLPAHILNGQVGPANDPSVAAFFAVRQGDSLGDRIELTEKDIIEQALLNNSFSRTNTARHLGISRVTLYNKMKKYGLLHEKK